MPHCMEAGSGPGLSPRAKGDGGDGSAETCTAGREEHEPKEAADCPEPPGEPSESPICDEVQAATTGATVAQAFGGQGEAEACETPLPWEEEYDDRLDREVEQRLGCNDFHLFEKMKYPESQTNTKRLPTGWD